jgi:hypothetical protein
VRTKWRPPFRRRRVGPETDPGGASIHAEWVRLGCLEIGAPVSRTRAPRRRGRRVVTFSPAGAFRGEAHEVNAEGYVHSNFKEEP